MMVEYSSWTLKINTSKRERLVVGVPLSNIHVENEVINGCKEYKTEIQKGI